MKSLHFTAGENEAQSREEIHQRSHGAIGWNRGQRPLLIPTVLFHLCLYHPAGTQPAGVLQGTKVLRALGGQEQVTSYHSPETLSPSLPQPVRAH